jgi:hypothetical protein
MNKYLTAALAALFLATPIAALAQDVPTYAGAPVDPQVAQDVPSYSQAPAPVPQDEQIRGRIVNFDGAYSLQVRDERGFLDNIQLHQGTIINPTGLTLAPGMVVSILGYNAGDYFAANEVDTPYTYDQGVPYYEGHPWDYYVGPAFGIGFFFGNLGWWHGDYFHGGFDYHGGARYYHDVHIENIYRGNGGEYHGGSDNHGYRGSAPVNTNPGETIRREPRAVDPNGPGYTHAAPVTREPRAVNPNPPAYAHTGTYTPVTRAPRTAPAYRPHDVVAPASRGGYYHGGSAAHSAPSRPSGGEHRSH